MRAFTTHTGLAAVLDRDDVDTDQVIPKQFLKRITRTGYDDALFFDWRFLDDGSPNPEFELNHPSYEGASILIAGRNFGCGSSREHAPWALNDYGFRAIIAPSFADIFRNNCFQNGLLTITLDEAEVRGLMEKAAPGNDYRPTIDLEAQTISDAGGAPSRSRSMSSAGTSLLNGLDDIGLTLQHEDKIGRTSGRGGSGRHC